VLLLCGRYAGFTWRELVDTTSLDQGDVCRHLRRVIDLLRQIPVLPKGLVPERLKNTARDAADRMDRYAPPTGTGTSKQEAQPTHGTMQGMDGFDVG
jgi:superfamily II RNA helicase